MIILKQHQLGVDLQYLPSTNLQVGNQYIYISTPGPTWLEEAYLGPFSRPDRGVCVCVGIR